MTYGRMMQKCPLSTRASERLWHYNTLEHSVNDELNDDAM